MRGMLRIWYLLKASQKEQEFESLIGSIEKTAGEMLKFPVNKMATKRQMKTYVDKQEGRMKSSHLRFHKLLGEGRRSSVSMLHSPQSRINKHSSGWEVHGLQNWQSQ